MKKLLWLFVAVPLAVLLIVFSVTNRAPVTMSLDPFSPATPAVSLTLPFFVFLFAVLLFGMILGGMATWLSQHRYRKAAKDGRAEAAKWRKEAETQRNRADELAGQNRPFVAPGLPAVPNRNRAA